MADQSKIDCPGSGPGPCGPGSGPDRPHRSKCLGQWRVDQPQFCEVQVQVVSGPDLGVGLGPDPDRPHFQIGWTKKSLHISFFLSLYVVWQQISNNTNNSKFFEVQILGQTIFPLLFINNGLQRAWPTRSNPNHPRIPSCTTFQMWTRERLSNYATRRVTGEG